MTTIKKFDPRKCRDVSGTREHYYDLRAQAAEVAAIKGKRGLDYMEANGQAQQAREELEAHLVSASY
jgi:hypothetical protein